MATTAVPAAPAVVVAVRDGRVEQVPEAGQALAQGAELVWVALADPDPLEVNRCAEALGLPLALLTDARAERRRPRLLTHGDARAVVLLPAAYDDEDEQVEVGGLVVLSNGRGVLTVSRDTALDLAPVRAALAATPSADALTEAVLARVVAVYDEVADGVDDDVDEVEVQVFSPERRSQARRIYGLKRANLELRRAVVPLAAVVEQLRCGSALQGKVLRLSEHVDRLDALIDSVLDADLAQVGVRQNEDQRRISAWAAIALVPTIVGGIYGMNFEHMPELSWRYGYAMALLVVLTVCTGLYLGFRRNGWLGPRASED